ncbi:hypothetical protein FE257_002320 [Aspergillus nanangensis]|uniref:Lytic polysaccharide monooxygenase n=1 Tax=Aspergillus nanangensis TaxID=2582783 RepID=A0AAD4CCT7_ASPNN|nr:hypothetical protein FE257_002320 [Aspergillus nanangensis]
MFVPVVACILSIIPIAGAHLILTNPTPFGQNTLNNSPLAADGTDFPCKLRSQGYESSGLNIYTRGEMVNLKFIGSITHGGGSCQISLSKDLAPSKDSTWMVIKSFEGGCPVNVDGNLDGGASSVLESNLNFTIPENLKLGKYTLAWTWFNRLGNREMYMNCAPIQIMSNPSNRHDTNDSTAYPPMFIANINGCYTKEGLDLRFPQPGNYERNGDPANLLPSSMDACTGVPSWG